MSSAGPRVRTLFFGSGEFAVPILNALADAPELEPIGVVTAPDKPAGRHGALTAVPVAERARELGIRLIQPSRVRAAEVLDELATVGPELAVLADYGQIIPPALLRLPPRGFLNVHPSLLPRHRGATPIQATILAGDGVAGVSIIEMDAGLDTGPVVASEAWPLRPDETAGELEARSARVGARLLRRILPGWLSGELVAMPQDTTLATLTRPLRREDGRLDPERPAVELERQVRALQPWPGSFVETTAGRLIVWRADVAYPKTGVGGDAGARAPQQKASPRTELPSFDPGTLVLDHDTLALTTNDGVLRLREVQLAGRRRVSGPELLRGYPRLVGSRVG